MTFFIFGTRGGKTSEGVATEGEKERSKQKKEVPFAEKSLKSTHYGDSQHGDEENHPWE